MSNDAFEQWRQEAASASPDPSLRPPARPLSGRSPWPAMSGILGMAATLLILFGMGWPPQLSSPLYLLAPVLATLVAVGARRPVVEVMQSVLAASAATFVTLLVAVPVWAVGEALECWASWLADC